MKNRRFDATSARARDSQPDAGVSRRERFLRAVGPVVCAFALPVCVVLLRGAPPQLNVEDVVRKIDELYRSKSSYSKIEMDIITPHWERTLRMDAWTEGQDKTFIRILAPAKEAGVATLRIGNEMWNYLPRADKIIKIPPSMMMSSWMGSDFTNDDLVNEFSLVDDYHYRFVRPDGARDDIIYVELRPKEGLPIVWGKIITAISRPDYLPVWERYYDENGNLIRIIEFEDVRELGGRVIPAVMKVLPQNKEGQSTVLRYLECQFNIPIPSDTFSLRNLRSKG